MKKTTLFFLLGLIILTSCEKDEPIETFDPLFTIDMETEALSFPTEGGTHSFELESNENWSIGDVPDWILVKVEDNGPSTRSTTYADGKKIVTLTITPNTQHTGRVAEIVMTSASGTVARLTITQDKKPELRGYWILSEGYANSNNSNWHGMMPLPVSFPRNSSPLSTACRWATPETTCRFTAARCIAW